MTVVIDATKGITSPADVIATSVAVPTINVQSINAGSANALSISTNGTTAVTISNTQQVMVNTTTPIKSYSLTSILHNGNTQDAIDIQNTNGSVNGTALACFNSSGTGIGSISMTQTGLILNVGTNGGVTFNNSSAISSGQTLNDYETGTWTPTLNSLSGGSASLSVTYASYTKIGRMVYCSMNISTTSSFSGSANQVYIGGLPFATNTNGSARYSGIVDYNTAFQAVCGIMVFNIGGGTGSAEAFFSTSDASSSATTFSSYVSSSAYLGSGKIIQGSFSYEASF